MKHAVSGNLLSALNSFENFFLKLFFLYILVVFLIHTLPSSLMVALLGLTLVLLVFVSPKVLSEDFIIWICWSFFIYFILQSPLFDESCSYCLFLYLLVKISVSAIIIYLLSKKYAIATLLMLAAYIVDFAFIKIVNLGISKTSTEFFSVWESTLALSIVGIVAHYLVREPSTEKKYIRGIILLLFVMGHLSNYWAAGLAKLRLDGGILSWVYNETHMNIARANYWTIENDFVYNLTQRLDLMVDGVPVANILVLATQIASVFAFLFTSLIAPLTIFYDIFHVAVGVAVGVWFYKWIFLNIIILVLIKQIYSILKLVTFRVRCLLVLGVVISPFYSSVVPLGWYETRQGDIIRAYGITDNGKEQELHSMFFGSAAFSVLQKDTHKSFETYVSGSQHATLNDDIRKIREKCLDELKHISDWSTARERIEVLSKRYMGQKTFLEKITNTLQPYHIVMPRFGARNTLFGEPINKIRFEVRNICFDKDGGVVKNEKLSEFYVRN